MAAPTKELETLFFEPEFSVGTPPVNSSEVLLEIDFNYDLENVAALANYIKAQTSVKQKKKKKKKKSPRFLYDKKIEERRA